MWGSAQNLDQDGLLGGAEGLHRLVVGGLGEILAIDLREEAERNKCLFVEKKIVKDATVAFFPLVISRTEEDIHYYKWM